MVRKFPSGEKTWRLPREMSVTLDTTRRIDLRTFAELKVLGMVVTLPLKLPQLLRKVTSPRASADNPDDAATTATMESPRRDPASMTLPVDIRPVARQ